MGYELSLDLYGGRLEIEADSMEELEEQVRALDLERLERLIAEKRTGPRAAPSTPEAQAAEAGSEKPEMRAPSKKARRKGAAKAPAKKASRKRATRE